MKKICFVVSDLRTLGGQQKIVAKIANALADSENFSVSILFIGPKEVSKTISYVMNPKIKLIYDERLLRQKKRYIPYQIATRIHKYITVFNNLELLKNIYFPKAEVETFKRFFDKKNYDVVIGIAPRISALIAMSAIKSKTIGWMNSSVERYFYLKKDALTNQIELYKNILPTLDELVVLTDSAKKEYSKFLGITPTRIYNPLTVFSEESSSLENKSLLFVGRIYYKTKGLELLLKSIKYLDSINVDFIVNIVGDGPDMPKLKQDISNMNLGHRVILHGSTTDVQSHYINNSILLVPSIVEGFGLVVTEGMEFGLPIISFETEGPSEIISDTEDGFLIQKYDYKEFALKAKLLLENKELRIKMGKNAKVNVQRFALRNIVHQWSDILGGSN